MSERYGNGSWQDRRERLMQAYFDLEANPLWRDILEQCHIQARDLDLSAGYAATDRDANRLHGRADGIRSLVSRALELRDARMAYFEEEEEKERLEYGQDSDFAQFGRAADSGSGAAAGKIQRRRLFAEIDNSETDA